MGIFDISDYIPKPPARQGSKASKMVKGKKAKAQAQARQDVGGFRFPKSKGANDSATRVPNTSGTGGRVLGPARPSKPRVGMKIRPRGRKY